MPPIRIITSRSVKLPRTFPKELTVSVGPMVGYAVDHIINSTPYVHPDKSYTSKASASVVAAFSSCMSVSRTQAFLEAKRKTALVIDKFAGELNSQKGTNLKAFAQQLRGRHVVINEMLRELLQNLKPGDKFYDADVVREGVRRIRAAFGPQARLELTSLTAADDFPFIRDHGQALIIEKAASLDAAPGTSLETGYLVFSTKNVDEIFALDPNVSEISYVVGASDIYERKNRGKAIDDTAYTAEGSLAFKKGLIERILELERQSVANGLRTALSPVRIRFYLSNCFGYQYKDAQGVLRKDEISLSKVVRLFDQAVAMGTTEVVICDTTAEADAAQVADMVRAVQSSVGRAGATIGLHLHIREFSDMDKALAAVDAGISVLDVSILNQGGNPRSGSHVGNLTTEDIVFILDALDVEMNVDIDRLMDTVRFMRSNLDAHFMSDAYSLGLDKLTNRERALLRSFVRAKFGSVSYTHLTLPTIYSV